VVSGCHCFSPLALDAKILVVLGLSPGNVTYVNALIAARSLSI
jgi:hypothetical protein